MCIYSDNSFSTREPRGVGRATWKDQSMPLSVRTICLKDTNRPITQWSIGLRVDIEVNSEEEEYFVKASILGHWR